MVAQNIYSSVWIDMCMKELNNEEKKEIQKMQNKLRVLLSVDALNVDKDDDIKQYTTHEKSSLVRSIVNALNITEFDTSYYDEGFQSKCTVEHSLKFISESFKYTEYAPLVAIYDDFVLKVAYGDLDALIEYDVFENYLMMLSLVSDKYPDIPSDKELGIEG